MTVEFIWKHYPDECDLCLECVDSCTGALTLTSLKRIKRNPKLCTRCECCSEICNAITTEFIK